MTGLAGVDRQLQWLWEGREAQDPPPRLPPTPEAQAPEQADRRPPGGTSPCKENWLALQSQICKVAKVVAVVPTFRTQ